MGLHRIARRYRSLGAGATADYLRRRLSNRLFAAVNRLGPVRRACPCCGWRGTRFLDFAGHGYGLSNYVCPRCGSHPRHRGLFLFLRQALGELGPRSAVLHLAPEPALSLLFKGRPDLLYVGADLAMRGVAVRADAARLPFGDATFAMVIASHVLEHLAEDRRALGEIARVTSLGGRALILVPTLSKWESQSTLEFGAPDPRLDGHWRTYGADLIGRIEAVGFGCLPARFSRLIGPAERRRYGIDEDVIFVARRLPAPSL